MGGDSKRKAYATVAKHHIMEYMQEAFEHEELGMTSDDTDNDDTADAVTYYVSHEELATDKLMEVLMQTEEASSQPKPPVLICDESLYLRVANWTQSVSNEIGHMKIAFNSLHSQYQSRVRLEKAKLRQLDHVYSRRMNMNNETICKFRVLHRESQIENQLLKEKLDVKEAEIDKFLEDREQMMKENMSHHRQILRLRRQISLLKKNQNKEEGSIKQRPRRCSAPSVLDLTS